MQITPIPIEVEQKVLAQVARGDKRVAIAKEHNISPISVTNIKKRNAELLAKMQDRVDNYRAKKAEQILDLSQQRIIERLQQPSPMDKITDYNAVSKTAYDQLRLEQGKATSISATAPISAQEATQENLKDLVKAIESGDEVELQKLIFRKQ